MNGLKVQDFHGKQVIDSRDVAQMVDRPHSDLMKSIRQYVKYLAEGEISLGDFFVESTYVDGNNQTRPNYLITKKGCDMVANKLPGKKGVLFTAAYVTAFEEMRQALVAPKRPLLPDGVVERLAAHAAFEIQQLSGDGRTCVRFVTSWATPQSAVDEFLRDLAACR